MANKRLIDFPQLDTIDGTELLYVVKNETDYNIPINIIGAQGPSGYTPVKGIDYFDGLPGSPGVSGISALSCSLSRPNPVLYKTQGGVYNLTHAGGVFRVYLGITDVSASCTDFRVFSQTSMVMQMTGNSYQPVSIDMTVASCKMRATYQGKYVYADYTVTLISDGAAGADLTVATTDVLYEELKSMMASGGLTPEKKYCITDFYTAYTQPNTNIEKVCGYNANDLPGDTSLYYESLIVTAATASELYKDGKSEKFPQDIIHYTVNNSNGSVKGKITYRKDTTYNIEAHEDWRNLWYTRWSDRADAEVVTTSAIGTTGFAEPLLVARMLINVIITERIESFGEISSGKFIWSQDSDTVFSAPVDITFGTPMHLINGAYILFQTDELDPVNYGFTITYDGRYWWKNNSYQTGNMMELPMIPAEAVSQGKVKDVYIGSCKGSYTNIVMGVGWDRFVLGDLISQVTIGDWTSDHTFVGGALSVEVKHNNSRSRFHNSGHCYLGMCSDGAVIDSCTNVIIGENSGNNTVLNSEAVTIGNTCTYWNMTGVTSVTIEDYLDGTDIVVSSGDTFRRVIDCGKLTLNPTTVYTLSGGGAVATLPITIVSGGGAVNDSTTILGGHI